MSQPTDKKQKFELVISNGESKEVQGVAWDSKPIQLACETVTETLMVSIFYQHFFVDVFFFIC